MATLDVLKRKVFQIDGLTITVGIVLLIVLAGVVYWRLRK